MSLNISVPYYMGDFVPGLEVPPPVTVLLPKLADGTQQERMATLNLALADVIADSTEPPMVYAADCVAIVGVIAGLQRKSIDPVLVFYDAHGDFNTWQTTESDFIGGMPLAMVTGRGEQTIVEGAAMKVLADTDAILVDGRDLDPGERELLNASDVHQVGVEEIAGTVPTDRPLYVHVDVDVVDPDDLPAINYPAPNGPSLDAVVASVASLAATSNVVAFSASTWNPELPGVEIAAAATHRIAAPFLE